MFKIRLYPIKNLKILMIKIIPVIVIVALSILFYQCDNNKKVNTVKNEDIENSYFDYDEKERKLISDKAWEEAHNYGKTITDTTFLQTRGVMSQSAIDALTEKGWNNDYAFNQVVYMAALERAKKHLSVKDNQFVFNLNSGAEINITEDLYQFIANLFVDWNTWIEDGIIKIVKTGEGYYDIEPVPNNGRVD